MTKNSFEADLPLSVWLAAILTVVLIAIGVGSSGQAEYEKREAPGTAPAQTRVAEASRPDSADRGPATIRESGTDDEERRWDFAGLLP